VYLPYEQEDVLELEEDEVLLVAKYKFSFEPASHIKPKIFK
jgi:hypothetical protein